MAEGRIGQVHEHALSVAKGGHANECPHGFDVATGLADEPADVAVGQFDLDRNRPATAFDRFHNDLIRFFGQGLRDVFN
jgi:hypothetical protein